MAHERKLLKRYMQDPKKINKDDIVGILDAFELWLQQDWITSDDWEAVEIVWAIMRNVTMKIMNFNTSAHHSSQLLRILEFSLKHQLVGKASLRRQLTLHGYVVKEILLGFLHPNHSNPDVIHGFLPHVFTLMRMELPHISDSAAAFVYTLNAYPELLIPYIDEILQCYLKYHHFNLAACLSVLFPHCEEKIMANLNAISLHVEDLPAMEKYSVFRLYQAVAEKYPQQILSYLRILTDSFSDTVVSSASLPCLCILSDHYPERFVAMVDKLSMLVERQPYHVGYVDKIFTNVAMQNETEARKILTNCLVQFKAVDEAYYPAIFTCIRAIGIKYKKLLQNYKSAITALGTSGSEDYVQSLMDFIDGNRQMVHWKLPWVTTKAKTPIRIYIHSTDPDFFKTKTHNPSLEQPEAVDQKNQKGNEKSNVSGGSCLKPTSALSAEKTALHDEKNVKNEDSKIKQTQNVNSVPEWCNRLAVLLDRDGPNDWRFLAVYLGFSFEDIQSFSKKTSPTCALLGHWCKTRDDNSAVHAVYVALQHVGRKDCLEVLTDSSSVNGMEKVAPAICQITQFSVSLGIGRVGTCKDELIPEMFAGTTEKISPVCISYHSGNHSEVKLLHYHLELAGLDCWMDKGKFISGEKLLQKMEEAMKGCQLVLVMCTSTYMTSPTCLKQVQLAQRLDKPIIPVIIGPLQWPPSGPMSVIFSQLPCVQLYEFSAQNRRGRIFWPLSHFLELLARICYYVPPRADKITKAEYKNWIPTLEKISPNLQESLLKFPIKQTRESNQAASVFICYQWDKLAEALVLNAVLSQLGFSCWLDVLNLGCVPLAEQAAKAIQSSKVMICCVTPKFTTLPSCCREVTLGCVQKIPIIPLVMEKMFWPPRGSVDLPLSKYSYIDFTCAENEAPFTSVKLRELYDRLIKYAIPRKEVNIEDILFTEIANVDVPVHISSDFESTDELEESGTVNAFRSEADSQHGNISTAGTDKEQVRRDQVLGNHTQIQANQLTKGISEIKKGKDGEYVTTGAKTGSTQQSGVLARTEDSVTESCETPALEELETAQLAMNHSGETHSETRKISNGVCHQGATVINNKSNGSAQHILSATDLDNGNLQLTATIDANEDDDVLPSKIDDDMKKSNVCTIL